jgi:transposase
MHELAITDALWEPIKPLLPVVPRPHRCPAASDTTIDPA